ncbi:MAG: A24 family peptidase [Pseudomonadota bacterium]
MAADPKDAKIYVLPSILVGFVALGFAFAAFESLSPPEGYLGVILALLLGLASIIDARHFILPDVITLPLTVMGLGIAAIFGGLTIFESAIGAVAGYTSFWLIASLYKRRRGIDGLGLGDAKLMAAAGAWCGVLLLPFVVLVGSVSALVWVAIAALYTRQLKATSAIPFGPFLSLGFITIWLAHQRDWIPIP